MVYTTKLPFFTIIIMKFIQKLHMSPWCALLISVSNGQRWRPQCIDNWNDLYRIIPFPFTPHIMKLHIKTPWVGGWRALLILGSKVTMHGKCFWRKMAFPLHTQSWNTQTLHESKMCNIDFWIERSRSQCSDYWKWFLLHNCFIFTSIIPNLYKQTPHELRMCPIYIRVKRSR